LYENGDVFFTKKINGEIKIYHEIKSKEEKEKLISDFFKNEKENRCFLTHRIELTGYTDQPGNIFLLIPILPTA
jgi:hypothetical protein